MKTVKIATSILAAAAAMLATALPGAAAGDTLANVRSATAIYTDPAAALAGGYSLLTDAQDIACIDEPGAGAMGVHYVNGSLVQGGTIDATRPQALVYEIQPDGHPQLVALEYVAIQSAWDSSHSSPPTLFGQNFMLTQAGNRYGLPAFYSLHTWLWKPNPKGDFEQWNPMVSCGGSNTATGTTMGLMCPVPSLETDAVLP